MSHPIIKVENLSKKYTLGQVHTDLLSERLGSLFRKGRGVANKETRQNFWALKDINFEVQKGEVVGIIGRNGAGKSTLLKILSRITSPTEGQVEMYGRVASLLEVGTGFHPELTGRENIFLNGAILGMSKAEVRKKLDEIVDFSEIEKFIDTPVKRYSSGMYVRLAFAVAAHLDPEILVVDEVLAVGDADFQQKCIGKMGRVAKEGRTIIFVSHNMGAVRNLCNRAILLDKGGMIKEGHVNDIVDHYLNKDRVANGLYLSKQEDLERYSVGNKDVKLLSVKVKSNRGITGELFIDEAIYIEIEYKVCTNNLKIYSSVHIKDLTDNCVFCTVNWPSSSYGDKYSGSVYEQGTYSSIVKIPENLLNEGKYYVNAIIMSNASSMEIVAENILEFNVIDTGLMRGEYKGYWAGIIRPLLEWSTRKT